jgi:hypothetical protein
MPEFDATTVYRPTLSLPKEFYRVGSDGSVWSCQKKGMGAGQVGTWRQLKAVSIGRGYLGARVGVNGVHKTYYVHRLVLEAFVGPCPLGMECCHENGDRKDNHSHNLRWDTPAANQADRIRHGTNHRGEKHYRAKLTAEKVREARRLAGEGWTPARLAEKFGVSDATVGNVVKRESWAHVE